MKLAQKVYGNIAIRRIHEEAKADFPLADGHIRDLSTVIEKVRGSRAVVLGCGLADTDSMGTAYAIQRLLGDRAVMATTTATNAVRKLLDALGLESVARFDRLDPVDYDALIIADASSSSLVPNIDGWREKLVAVIDHHLPTPTARSDLRGGIATVVDTNMPSACSIVALATPDDLITESMALALASGLVVDSAGMTRGEASSLFLFGYLLQRSGLPQEAILRLSFNEMDSKLRCQMLASFGAAAYVVQDHILAIKNERRINTPVFAAALAERLTAVTRQGPASDIALCTVPVGDRKIHFSARAIESTSEALDMNIAASKASTEFGGVSGGHVKSAGGDIPTGINLQAFGEAFRAAVAEQLASV